ncbi:MAG: carboxypeptidase-like regulatory domain-containing protein [Bacteroidetes bacterium]|nr:carboxypeptidase-like regulatory domain-containing protein [Bacteroidota bacterium]
MLRKWGMIALMMLATPVLVFAQNTGKLSGLVTDGDTGDPLPGATVLVVGTQLGSITDVDGNYFIIGVPVGNYDLQASFVGYQNHIVQGVDVSTGYTQEVNFILSPGVELDEIIIEYERPLIQKDAIGVLKIVTAEEIVNLPVRGTVNIAKIQAGVVSQEGSGTLNIRGGRGEEVTFYIDGIKVFGSAGVPQSAVQEQEMLIGSISARYGDAMSGIINITTKSGSTKFFGSFEGITSESIDDWGYNLISGAIGGPIGGDKLNFFLSAEYVDQDDDNPSSFGELFVSDDVLNDLRAFPTVFGATDAEGNDVFLKIPATLADGATMTVDDEGLPVTDGGNITFSDGTTIPIGSAVSFGNLRPQLAAELINDEYSVRRLKRKNASNNLRLAGNFTVQVLSNARLRVGGRYNADEGDTGVQSGTRFTSTGSRRVVFAPEMADFFTRDDVQLFGTWTHYLSNNTFYQLQIDWSDRVGETYDPRFGTGFEDFFNYADLEHPEFLTLSGYKNLALVEDPVRVDALGNPTLIPTFNNTYEDGNGPATSDEVVATMLAAPGGRFNTYSKFHNNQFRFTASATTQVGLHQLEFGGEYETRTQRSWGTRADLYARYAADANGPEQISATDPDLPAAGFSSYDQIPNWLLNNFSVNTGYDIRGENEVDSEDFECYLDRVNDKTKPLECFNQIPYEPIYYGGYIQDKIEFRDIVLNLGLRVDVFDNNTRVLIDKFSRRPVVRVRDGGSHPANMGSDFAIYFSGDDIVGYRDVNGGFFDEVGAAANPGDIILSGKPTQTDGDITEAMFTDYDPEVNVMPRIGVSFPVTDQALFFASFGVVTQRPTGRNFEDLAGFRGTGGISNTALVPEKTTAYELGFRQRVGARAAFTISGFFKQIENKLQLREIRGASPSVYSSFENVDFGTVKGVEFGFDLRRTGGFSANVNYTLAFADGTGSGDRTTSTIVWVDETPPNFISALDFDQRHKLNASFDYRFGQGEGPTIAGTKLLQNFGLNVLFTAGSGFPYTAVEEPFNLAGAARAANPRGVINGDRMPGNTRIDIRLDRRFRIGQGTSLSAFIWIQNLLDEKNTNNVWRFTGLPDNDGFLATAQGARFLADKPVGAEKIYRHRNRPLDWVGFPRLTRVGVRVDF